MSRLVKIIPFGLGCMYSFDEAVELLKEEGRIDPDTDWLIWGPDCKKRKAQKKPEEKPHGQ